MGRRLMINDLTSFVSASDPQLSPDLEKVSLVALRADEERDDYSTAIWILNRSDGEPVSYLGGEKDHCPRWSRDGRQLLFLSKRGLREGGKGDSLWVTRLEGEPMLVIKLEMGIDQPQWSPDGKRIYFISGLGEAEEDVKVVDRIPMWFDSMGFTYHKRRHLHVVDASSGLVSQLTEGDINVVCSAISNKGRQIAYAASTEELEPRKTDLFIRDLGSGEDVKILTGHSIESICWSPEDDHIAFLGSDLRRGFATHVGVWAMPAHLERPENLTEGLDRGCERRIYYDLRSPFAGMPAPKWDDGYIYFPLSDGGRFNLYRMGFEDREVEPIVEGDLSVDEFSVRNGVVAYSKVTATEPAEVWTKEGASDKRLTKFNDSILSRLELVSPERFEYRASDGQLVEGWILKPNGIGEGEKRPAILDIHGGPKSKFGASFMFEHQLYASEGYAVIYMNPRGSDGYGEEFADIRGEYGNRDYRDIMEGVDHAIMEYGFIDQERMGVTGLSYGGFMTNWIVTHTDRFRAAVSQNGISHWPSFFGTSDIGFHFTPDAVGGDIWSNERDYKEKSPLTHAPRVETPIMFIHSFEDYRCWIDQSITFHTALRYLGKETRLVLFMEGSHSFRSLAKPSIRKKRLEHMIAWFNGHLKKD